MKGTHHHRIRASRNRDTGWCLGPRNPRCRNAAVLSGLRFYASELGRWLSRDPIGEEGGCGLYVACHNSATMAVDDIGAATRWSYELVGPSKWHYTNEEYWGDWYLSGAEEVGCPCTHIIAEWSRMRMAKKWGKKRLRTFQEERSWCWSVVNTVSGWVVGAACGSPTSAAAAAAASAAGAACGAGCETVISESGWKWTGIESFAETNQIVYIEVSVLGPDLSPLRESAYTTAPCNVVDFSTYKPK